MKPNLNKCSCGVWKHSWASRCQLCIETEREREIKGLRDSQVRELEKLWELTPDEREDENENEATTP